MAIKYTKILEKLTTIQLNGVVIETRPQNIPTEVYVRVDSVVSNKSTQEATITLLSMDKSLILDTTKVSGLPIDLNDPSNNIIQAYKELKKLPEFKDANDC